MHSAASRAARSKFYAAQQSPRAWHAGKAAANQATRIENVKKNAPKLRSVGHDLGDAEQDDEGEEQQVDIRLHLAGVAKSADLGDDLLA